MDQWLSQRFASQLIALPDVQDGQMCFRQYNNDTQLVVGEYNILTPSPDTPSVTTAREHERLQLLLMPLVAYDDGGNRLGMGGGYYDRWLADQPQVQRIGIAYACQHSSFRLPTEVWDIPLHAVVTEQGVLWF